MSQAEDRARDGEEASPQQAEDELQPGTRIGGYTILDTIGSGGMGRVYLARDTHLHRKVAIKSLLARGRSTDDQRARILREARAAAQVNHANVATIHEFLEDDGRAFIVMEYVEGQSLSTVLRRDRLPAARVATIGRQLAQGLTAAHARGVVHRDLKPANVKLTEDGSAKILDFGVAGMTTAFTTVSTDGIARDEARQDGQPGTPGYMSPEQLLSRKFDERTDVFSLGVVLFEMATGERAFPHADAQELVEKMSRPLRRADGVDARVPKILADVISRAVEIAPEQRFSTASAIATALANVERQLQTTSAVVDATTATVITVGSSTTRRAGTVAGTIAGLAALLTLLGYLNTTSYDFVMERSDFADETVLDWLGWGYRAMFSVTVILLATLALIAMLRGIRTVALPISKRGANLDSAVRLRVERTRMRLGMDQVNVRASWLLIATSIALAATWWLYLPFIEALLTRVSQASADQLTLLSPSRETLQQTYQKLLTGTIVLGVLAWVRLSRPLLRSGSANRGFLVGGGSVILLALISLQLPYRFFIKEAQFPLGKWNNVSCYLVAGDKGPNALVFCPSLPQRTHKIARSEFLANNPAIEESVFTSFGK